MSTVQYQLQSPKLRSQKSIIDIASTNANASKIHQLFNLPQFSLNKKYQATIKQIIHSIIQFDKFTDNLESKVDNLLAAQQNQFVQSYQKHMKKIEGEFKVLEQQAQKQEELIKYYENQGKMSNLIKKVAMLEEESKRLYSIIEKKQKQIKTIKLQNKVQKDENKRLYNQIKQILKTKNLNQTKSETLYFNEKQESLNKLTLKVCHNNQQQDNHQKFFATQIQPQLRSLKNQLSTTTVENKKLVGGFTYNLSQNSILCPEAQEEKSAMKKKITALSLKNKKLTKFSSKVLQSRNQLETLFVNSVAQIKKQIIVKRKIKDCSFQDFKKQDKINLLLTIISNDQVLKFVYEKIFYTKDQKECLSKQNSSMNTGMDRQKSYFTANESKRQNLKRGNSVLPYLH